MAVMRQRAEKIRVVGRDAIIRARFVDPDYRKRVAMDVIVDALSADFLIAEIRER